MTAAALRTWLPVLLLAAAAAGICLANRHLAGLPLYWDELGVYGPAILYQADHGISLLPAGLPPEYSRGHPLLFFALMALGIKVMGYSLLKLHLLALAISLATAAVLYRTALRWLPPFAAAAVAVLWLLQPNWQAMAFLALPEMLLALWVLLALDAAARARWRWYLCWAVCAVLTKESGLILPLAVGMGTLLRSPLSWRAVGLAFLPGLAFLLFIAIQKLQHGWWLFPLHTGFVSVEPQALFRKLRRAAAFLLADQGRVWMSLGVLAGLILHAVQAARLRRLRLPAYALYAAGWAAGLTLFTAMNFYMERYLLSLLPLLPLLLGALWMPLLSERQVRWAVPAAVLLLAAGCWMHRSRPVFRYDQDVNYADYVRVQQDACRFVTSRMVPGAKVTANFPAYNGLLDARLGYLAPGDSLQPYVTLEADTDWALVITPPAPPMAYAPLQARQPDAEFREGPFLARVYRLP
ncbi:MAG: hypothetical protein NW241_00410 [Bacteroidia bacterium]|nr:hypothetical protein [Bacteroidia bacterium]